MGVSRRGLIRAGLSAAPVVAALKTNTVLAGTSGSGYCVRPSAFASIQATQAKGHVPSRYQTGNDDHKKYCRHPSEWGSDCGGFADHKFHYDYKTGKCLSFKNSPLSLGTNCKVSEALKFHDATACRSKGINPVSGKLASYLTSCYLIAVEKGDENCYLKKDECKAIWEKSGNWSPAPGVNWAAHDTIAYLDYLMAYGCKT